MTYSTEYKITSSIVFYDEYSFLAYALLLCYNYKKGKVPHHSGWNGVFLIKRKGVMGQFVVT